MLFKRKKRPTPGKHLKKDRKLSENELKKSELLSNKSTGNVKAKEDSNVKAISKKEETHKALGITENEKEMAELNINSISKKSETSKAPEIQKTEKTPHTPQPESISKKPEMPKAPEIQKTEKAPHTSQPEPVSKKPETPKKPETLKTQEIVKAPATLPTLQNKNIINKKKRSETFSTEDLDFANDCLVAHTEEKMLWPHVMLLMVIVCLTSLVIWAAFAELDEVTKGIGRVIPSSSIQIIQSLEGGLLENIQVREGDIVEAGAELLRIDDTQFLATLKETEARIEILESRIARLEAEVNMASVITFPKSIVQNRPDLINNETLQFNNSQKGYQAKLDVLQRNYHISKEEFAINEPLFEEGIISQVELLHLKRNMNEAKGAISKHDHDFLSRKFEDLNQTRAKLEALQETKRWHQDRVTRTVMVSPVRGTIKKSYFSTIGGVIKPGEPILEIVPLEDTLLIEADIRPADIAFIHPDQEVVVKITAYDFSIYGGMEGKVEHISADTITNDKGESFYQINVRTHQNSLSDGSKDLPIIPGMVAEVNVLTGKKTILQYLMKPILRAKANALHER